ncbi:MAG: hypothetical protein HYY84_02060 [Deltaproteobacteria bacterium]|nr:hypothetical protein [Deltaproteobacteria bacterium]
MKTAVAVLLFSVVAFAAGFYAGRRSGVGVAVVSEGAWFDLEEVHEPAPRARATARAVERRQDAPKQRATVAARVPVASARVSAAVRPHAGRDDAVDSVSRERLLSAVSARAGVVAPCFRTDSDVPRLDVEMRVEPDGRVTSVRIGTVGGVPRAALSCAEKALAALHFGSAAVDRTRSVVWALDLRNREEAP